MKGKFIVLEGSDGSGKTTVLQGLKAFLAERELPFLYSREPGGTPVGEKIRDLLLDTDNEGMGGACEALLYAASRAEHVEKRIRPALEAGQNILSDRFTLSSLAYQGRGRELGLDEVAAINHFATGGLEPDLVLFLDVDPIRVLERKGEVAPKDRLEQEDADFFNRVYQGYLDALPYMKHCVRIDASRSPQEVLEACEQAIVKVLEV